MHYAPGQESCPLPFSPFKSCTVPRPIGWLSTISGDGVPNLAPYSQWQNLSFDPPLVMFAANQLSSGERKHTVLNAEETGWFVWNMATYDLRDAVNASAVEWAAEEDEFAKAGVTPIACVDGGFVGSGDVEVVVSLDVGGKRAVRFLIFSGNYF